MSFRISRGVLLIVKPSAAALLTLPQCNEISNAEALESSLCSEREIGRLTLKPKSKIGLSIILLILYVGLFCLLGFYSAPSADDFSNVTMLRTFGFWRTQVKWYLGWGGRLTQTVLLSLVYKLDNLHGVYFLLPCLTVFSMFAALYFSVRTLASNLSSARQRLFVSLVLLASWLASIPVLNEILYWLTGMFYTWSAVGLLLCLSACVLWWRKQTTSMFMLTSVLIFFNALIVELNALLQLISLLCLLVYTFTRRKTHWAGVLLFFLAAFLGLLVTVLAPGNAARMTASIASRFSPVLLLKTLGVASIFGAITIAKFFLAPITYVFLLFLPDLVRTLPSFDKNMAVHLKIWHILILTALIAPLMHAIAGWATGAGLPERAESLTLWMMGAVWFLLWSFGYRRNALLYRIRGSRLHALRWFLLALTLVLSPNFMALLGDISLAPAYRAELEVRDAQLARQREAGEVDAVVPLLSVRPTLLFFSDLRPWPSDWKNQAYAQYHGVKSVQALPPVFCSNGQTLSSFRQESVKGLETLAAEGNVQAQFLLGELYDTTFAGFENVPKDNAQAAIWYLEAAREGYAHAQRRLARLYATGDGVARNYFEAAYWLVRSQF